MTAENLKFGFIGCGKVSRFHAEVIQSLGHKIEAVSARENSKNIVFFGSDYNVQSQYSDWRQMVENQDLDALVVATSWNETEKLVQEVIETGLPCLVEKPVALNVKNFEKFYKKIKNFSPNVLVGYNRRFYDFIPDLKKSFEERELLSVQFNFPETLDQMIQNNSLSIKNDVLLYSTSHCLDLLIYLLGPLNIEWVNNSPADSIHGVLKTKNNVPIHLEGDFNTPSNTSIKFNFKNIVYQLLPIEKLTIYEGMDIKEPTNSIPIRRFIPKRKEEMYTDTRYKPGFLKQMKCFIDVCVTKIKELDQGQGCTLENALNVTKLCEGLKRGRTRGRV